mmetsp:Transcript_44777/g.143428  ORF Transcript_44777/g.143428 Transcript_44777/m.143428 type:complete len:344 (+) Transcript_44777:35-1066(+)
MVLRAPCSARHGSRWRRGALQPTAGCDTSGLALGLTADGACEAASSSSSSSAPPADAISLRLVELVVDHQWHADPERSGVVVKREPPDLADSPPELAEFAVDRQSVHRECGGVVKQEALVLADSVVKRESPCLTDPAVDPWHLYLECGGVLIKREAPNLADSAVDRQPAYSDSGGGVVKQEHPGLAESMPLDDRPLQGAGEQPPPSRLQRRGLVIGQAPPRPPDRLPPGYQPLQGPPERRLTKLGGFKVPADLWANFDRLDLLGWCPGPKPRKPYHDKSTGYSKHDRDGHIWPRREARLVAGRLRQFGSFAKDYAMVVLCGRYVAAAFGPAKNGPFQEDGALD